MVTCEGASLFLAKVAMSLDSSSRVWRVGNVQWTYNETHFGDVVLGEERTTGLKVDEEKCVRGF